MVIFYVLLFLGVIHFANKALSSRQNHYIILTLILFFYQIVLLLGGFFMSTGFPGKYPENTICSWYIYSSQTHPILVCLYDFLAVEYQKF